VTVAAPLVACVALVPVAAEASEVLVRYAPGVASERQRAVERQDGAAGRLSALSALGVEVVRVPDEGSAQAVARRLDRRPEVLFAEPNHRVTAAAQPDDPRFTEQYALENRAQTGGVFDADIDAPEAWSLAGLNHFPSDGGAAIGVVDSGVDPAHEDLASAISAWRDGKNDEAGLGATHRPLPRRQRSWHARQRHRGGARRKRARHRRCRVQRPDDGVQGAVRRNRLRHGR
jgi:subtilisin family serine protease